MNDHNYYGFMNSVRLENERDAELSQSAGTFLRVGHSYYGPPDKDLPAPDIRICINRHYITIEHKDGTEYVCRNIKIFEDTTKTIYHMEVVNEK